MGSSDAKGWSSGFGFNEVDFSDRVLRLEIAPLQHCNTSDGSNTAEIGASTDLKLKKIHVNSLMLASRSHFFYKLLVNGTKETQQRYEVALMINESEEKAFMHLLKFIYGIPFYQRRKNGIPMDETSAQDLVDVIITANKFGVPSCVKYCVDVLLKLPMSTELAVLYLALPSSVLADGVVQTLIKSAKKFLCGHYKNFKSFKEEAMELPLCAVEIVIGSDGLEVDSEDDVFNFMLKWGRLRYPELEERRDILTRLLLNFVCLPKMSSLKLNEAVNCSDFDSEKVYKPVLDALFSKDQDVPIGTTRYEYPKRVYSHGFAVKVVQFQLDRPQCVVYFDLDKKDCVDQASLFSDKFCLGGQYLCLNADFSQEDCLLYISLDRTPILRSCTTYLEHSMMKKSSKEFTCPGDLIELSWDDFFGEESEYFIDGILHMRANITLFS